MDIGKYLKDLNTNTATALVTIRKYSTNELTYSNIGECSIADLLEHICISDNKTYCLLLSEPERICEKPELYGDEKLKKIVVDYKGGPKITETEIKELTGAVSDFLSFEKYASLIKYIATFIWGK